MTYTHAVFSETLRLHPSVPKQAKTAVAEDILPDGTIIPAGTIVAWSSWCMGRMPQLWGTNALQFDPSRFVNTQHSPFKYPAFNMGPRLCLGMNMAYLEAVLALAVLLENFDLRVVDRAKVHYQNGLTLPMRDGLRVWVGKRDGSTLGGVEG